MDGTYAEVGVWVILGKHKGRPRSWCDCMDRYVGKKAQITRITRCSNGRLACIVNGYSTHPWRVEDMILASDVPLLTPEQKRQLNIEE